MTREHDESGSRPLLHAAGLTVDYPTESGMVRVVDGLDLTIRRGQRIAIVGESGSGKSATARALLRINPEAVLGGTLELDDLDLLRLPERRLREIRGSRIGMVFQDPFGSLNPSMRIGDQIAETLRIHGVPRDEARERALATLRELGVPRAEERMRSYPHEFSGGMRQRVALAMSLVAEPDLLIADEVTTALDTRVQQQVLDLMYRVSVTRDLSVILISHDLGVVARFADRVAIMYAGRVVEEGDIDTIFTAPKHPYTAALLHAVPRLDDPAAKLTSIPGVPPSPAQRPPGCSFHPRCAVRLEECSSVIPVPQAVAAGGVVACHLFDQDGGAQ